MFPFESRWRWVLKTGYLHLAEAIEDRLDVFHEPYRSILKSRAKGLQVAVSARALILVLLNVGVVVMIAAWVAALFPELGWARAWLSTLAGSLTGLSLLFTVFFLLITRYLGQLQADVIACMALGTPGAPELNAEEQDRLRDIEARSNQAGWMPPLPYEQEPKTWQEEDR